MEICKLVGCYILHKLNNALPNLITELYCDGCLIVIEKNISNVDVKQFKKTLHKVSNEIRINLDIKNPSLKVNYQDLSFNLYDHLKSNHPSAILKQIPKMI